MSRDQETLLWRHTRQAVNDALLYPPHSGPWLVSRREALDLRNQVSAAMWSETVFFALDVLYEEF